MSDMGMCEGCSFEDERRSFVNKECSICIRNPSLVSRVFKPTTYLGHSVSRPVDMFMSRALKHMILEFFENKVRKIEDQLKREQLMPRYIPPKPLMQPTEMYYNPEWESTGMNLINPSLIEEKEKESKDTWKLMSSNDFLVLGECKIIPGTFPQCEVSSDTLAVPLAVTFKGIDSEEPKEEEETQESPEKEGPGRVIKLSPSKLMEDLEEVGEGDEG